MSSDRELLLDLLGDAYRILLAYGVERSSNMDRVLLMDAIKLELEHGGVLGGTAVQESAEHE